MKTSVAGVGPNMNGAVPCRRASSSHMSISSGFTTSAAPNCCASSRRRRLVSMATTSRMPRSANVAMASSPIGPHPTTATRSPGATSPWLTACMPTAAGSASAATRRSMPLGNGEQPPALGGLSHEEERREPALGRAAAQPAQLLVRRMDDDPVTHRDAVDLAAGPLDHAGHLVAESHGPPGDASHDGRRRHRCRRSRTPRCGRGHRGGPGVPPGDRRGGRHWGRAPESVSPVRPLPRPDSHSPAHGSAVCRAAAPRVG